MEDALKPHAIPKINISSVRSYIELPNVSVDNVATGAMGAQHLLDTGMKTFAYYGLNHHYANLRRQGFEQALAARGYDYHRFDYDPERQLKPPILLRDEATKQWLDALPKPIAILVADEREGVKLAEHIRMLGLSIPEDVALLVIGDDPIECGLSHPPLSGVRLPGELVGQEAARRLDLMMSGHPFGTSPVLLPPLGITIRLSTRMLMINDPDIRIAVNYITDHIGEQIEVNDVVNKVQISRAVLDKRFLRERGRSVQGEIRYHQLNHARTLLLDSDMTIGEIATACGFPHHSHLTVAFKRDVGQTPASYRTQYRR